MKFSLRKCAQAGPAWPSNVANAQQGTVPAALPLVLGPLELPLLGGLGRATPCNVRRSRLILPCPKPQHKGPKERAAVEQQQQQQPGGNGAAKRSKSEMQQTTAEEQVKTVCSARTS